MFTKFKLQVHMYVLVLYKGIECRNTVKVRIKLLVIKLFLLMEGKCNERVLFPRFLEAVTILSSGLPQHRHFVRVKVTVSSQGGVT